MKFVICILLGAILCFGGLYLLRSLWSFSAQNIDIYASEKPIFDIREALKGQFIAEGVIYDYTGNVNIRFHAKMNGQFSDRDGTLDESFTYSDGFVDQRNWKIKFEQDGSFTATAPDVIGTATGQQKGNAVVMRYKLRLAERAGGHVLDVTDWMYLLDSGVVINRSEMRKFGIKVAELVGAFYKDKDGLKP